MSDANDEISPFGKDAGDGTDIPAMPSLSDIPKPPLRRDFSTMPASETQAENGNAPAVPAPPPPPRPDMAPNRPVFASPMPPVSPLPEQIPSPPKPPAMMPPPPPPPAMPNTQETPVAAPVQAAPLPPVSLPVEPPVAVPVTEPLMEMKETESAIPAIAVSDASPSDIFSEPEAEEPVTRKAEQWEPEKETERLVPEEPSYTPPAPPPFPSSQSSAGGATAINQGVFDEVLRQHDAWLKTDGKEGRRANLYGLDLTQIDFTHADLQQANLRGAILDGVDLSGALLNDADLTEASLQGCRATGANWLRVNLASATLQRSVLDNINFSFANAIGANFSEASLKGAVLQQVNLREASLVAVDFTDADMSEAVCRGADATRARFIRTVMTRADMRESLCVGCEFVEASMQGVNFRNAKFDNTPFSYSDFSVAVDISLEYQSVGFQVEKENIQQEKHELKQMQASVQQKQAEVMEMKLQMEEQRNLMLSLKADETIYIGGLEKIRGRMKIVRGVWLSVLVLLLAATGLTIASMSLDQLNVVELGVVFIVPVCILLLILFTLGQISAALKRVGHHSMIRERKIASLQQNSELTGRKLVEAP